MLMSFTREVFALVKNNTMTMRIPIPIPLLKLKTLKYEWNTVGNTGYIEITATTEPHDLPSSINLESRAEMASASVS